MGLRSNLPPFRPFSEHFSRKSVDLLPHLSFFTVVARVQGQETLHFGPKALRMYVPLLVYSTCMYCM